MKKTILPAPGKRANKSPTTTPEPEWVAEPAPTPEQDALTAERNERQHRLDVLNRLINGVR